jgi:hypothetical protein
MKDATSFLASFWFVAIQQKWYYLLLLTLKPSHHMEVWTFLLIDVLMLSLNHLIWTGFHELSLMHPQLICSYRTWNTRPEKLHLTSTHWNAQANWWNASVLNLTTPNSSLGAIYLVCKHTLHSLKTRFHFFSKLVMLLQLLSNPTTNAGYCCHHQTNTNLNMIKSDA